MHNRILIIDNDEAILDVMKDALTGEKFHVNTVTTIHNIFAVIEEFMPDLIIVDYILHDINGGEICSQIKKNPKTSHLPVIIISGHSRVLKSLGTYGSDAILEKPFDLKELIDTVKGFLLEGHLHK